MEEVTYSNLLAESQSNLWTALKSDATIASYTKNVLDGVPLGLTSGTGFPYVIVPTPTINEKYLTLGNRKMSQIEFKVQVFDRKESMLRKVCDAVRACCETNKTTFQTTYGMYKYLNSSTNMSYVVQEDNSVVYNYEMTILYEWVQW